MNINVLFAIKRNVILLISTVCFISLSACIDNHIVNEWDHQCGNGSGGSSDSTSGGQLQAVAFTAEVNQLVTKSGTTPLQADRNVDVYSLYNMGDYITTTSYYTETPGVLTSVRNIPLSLYPGLYEFYALSIGNSSQALPSVDISTGFVSSLQNGLDYLASQQTNVSISGSTTIGLTFNHACSQLMITILPGSSTTVIDSIASATISQPITTTTFLSVYTGKIPQVTTLSTTPIAMNIVDSLCNQILLPMKRIDSLTMNFSVYVNGETDMRPYTVKIPLVDQQMISGSSYQYQINLSEEKVYISTATVNDWTDVDETGTPLTPTPN